MIRTNAFTDRLMEISMFFDDNDVVHQTMKRVAATFEAAGVPYAIVGGRINPRRADRPFIPLTPARRSLEGH